MKIDDKCLKNIYQWDELCCKANKQYTLDALNQYSDEELHLSCLLAESDTRFCREEINNFKRGKVTPNLLFARSPATFANALSTPIAFVCTLYSAFTTAEENDYVVPPFPNKLPDVSTQAKLENFLKKNGFERLYATRAPVWQDVKRRDVYLKTLQELLETGSALAKRVGNEACAHKLLTALCLARRKSTPQGNAIVRGNLTPPNGFDPVMTYDKATNLYALIESALASLWAAVSYRELKPLAMSRKKAK